MKKKILLAEDDQAIVEVVKLILEQEGFLTLVVLSGDEIYKTVKKQSPDLILLDIWLSGSDGGVIAKSLKNDKDTRSIPIILISASNDTEKVAKASGVDGFLLKPFDIDDLLATVRKFCKV